MHNLSTSDWLSITTISVEVLSILVSGIIAIWIAKVIQSQIDNESKLKGYFTSETICLKNEIQQIIKRVLNSSITPVELKNDMGHISRISTCLMNNLKEKYNIDDTVTGILLNLSDIVMDNREFEENFRNNSSFVCSDSVKAEVKKIDSENIKAFNALLLKIYE